MSALTIWGYPLALTAVVEVLGYKVDVSEAFEFDAKGVTGLHLNSDKALSIIGAAEADMRSKLGGDIL